MTSTSAVTDIVAPYRERGYFLPYRVIDEAAARGLRADYENAERSLADDPAKLDILRQYPHLVFPLSMG